MDWGERERKIQRNYQIAITASQRIRRYLAVYRLNKFLGLQPEEIASRIYGNRKMSYYIKAIIGEVFGLLCTSDSSCPFTKLFEEMGF